MDHHGVYEDPDKRLEVVTSVPFQTEPGWPWFSSSPGIFFKVEVLYLTLKKLNSHEDNRSLKDSYQPFDGEYLISTYRSGALSFLVFQGLCSRKYIKQFSADRSKIEVCQKSIDIVLTRV